MNENGNEMKDAQELRTEIRSYLQGNYVSVGTLKVSHKCHLLTRALVF